MKYKPKKTLSVWGGILLGLAIFAFFFWGIDYSISVEFTALRMMLFIPLSIAVLIFALLVIGALRLSFVSDQNGLTINWGLFKKRIAWSEIDEIIVLKGDPIFMSVLGGGWWNYTAGLYLIKGIGAARIFGFGASKGLVLTKTKSALYGLTCSYDDMFTTYGGSIKTRIIDTDLDEEANNLVGENYRHDKSFMVLYVFNYFLLASFTVFTAIAYSTGIILKSTILLLVLAFALLFLNLSNAKRIYYFSTTGGYVLLALSILITFMLLIISILRIV